MRKRFRNYVTLFLAAFILIFLFIGIFNIYRNQYMLSVYGRIQAIRIEGLKQEVVITVDNREIPLGRSWPVLRQQMEVGDSIVKFPRVYSIRLIKKDGRKINCPH